VGKLLIFNNLIEFIMNGEIQAEFVLDENGDIKTSTHKDRLYSEENKEPVEIETVFAQVKITDNSEEKILKIPVNQAQLSDEQYQKNFLQEVVYNQRLGWLDL
jgi:hypothetical protein